LEYTLFLLLKNMQLDIARLCCEFDEAQKKFRGLTRQDQTEQASTLVLTTRRQIVDLVEELMTDLATVPVNLTTIVELTYFNSWFNKRDGWLGSS
jgi:hypothetical protein